MSDHDKESKNQDNEKKYDVGYGKPPKHTRFQKGQSGNPKGRPKGSKNFKTIIKEELNKRVIIKEGGDRVEVTKLEAFVMTLVNGSLGSKNQCIKELITILKELEAEEEAKEARRNSKTLKQADHEILQRVIGQHQEKEDDDE